MKFIASCLFLLCVVSVLAVAQPEQRGYQLHSLADSLGYQAGWNFGLTVKKEGADVNIPILIAGAYDVLTYSEARLPLGEIDNILTRVRLKLDQMIRDKDTVGDLALKIYGKSSKNGPDKIKTSNDSLSYAIGYNYGLDVKDRRRTLSPRAVSEGLADCLQGKESLLTLDDELALEMYKQFEKNTHQTEMKQFMEQQKQFLEENAKRSEVHTLPSGIQYEILNSGEGTTATMEDDVTVHIKASKLNENPYFNTYRTDQPLNYKISEAAEDWKTILTQMPIGARWKLWIPPDTTSASAFKDGPPQILKFEVEMISISSIEQ